MKAFSNTNYDIQYVEDICFTIDFIYLNQNKIKPHNNDKCKFLMKINVSKFEWIFRVHCIFERLNDHERVYGGIPVWV